jgi:pilus assembly protein CpaE
VDETRETLQRELNACADLAWLEADCQRYDVFMDVVQQNHPDVAIVSIDGDETLAIPLIQQLTSNFPQLAVIAVSSNSDARFASDMMRMGVRDFVAYPPRSGELAEVLGRIAPAILPGKAKAASVAAQRRVIAFAGTDGGVGSTTLAVNIGCILAQDPNYSVVLVDLDLFLGDAHVCLDLSPRTTVMQLIDNIDQLDNAYLKRAVTRHESGLHLIPHPDRLSEVGQITAQHISRLIVLLKRSFTHILIDVSKSFSPVDVAAIEAADDVLLAMQLDMSSLYNLLRLQESFADRPGLMEKIRLAANRVGSEIGISVDKAVATIGREISYQIPNDTRTAVYARDNGKPLYSHARGTKVFQSILQIANSMAGRDRRPPAPVGANGGSGLFGRLFGGKK